MNQIFPFANLVTGILVLIVGFVFHWIGQLISVINWEFAKKIGVVEKGMPKEFKVYEQAIAIADSLIGWIFRGVINFYGFLELFLFTMVLAFGSGWVIKRKLVISLHQIISGLFGVQ